MIKKVEIYTASYCGYCHRAKALLTEKNINFIEYDVTSDQPGRDKMSIRAQGRTSVPQIFIDDKHIGGCDDLFALEKSQNLDGILEKE